MITTGAGAFKPKALPLSMDDDTQKRIHYFIKDPQKFVGQTVGVFGGGDSALDLALELANYANVKIILAVINFAVLNLMSKNLSL